MLRYLGLMALASVIAFGGCATPPGAAGSARRDLDWESLDARMRPVMDFVEGGRSVPEGLEGEALAAAEAMRTRQPEIHTLLRQGILAETNRGYLRLWEASQTVDAARRNALQKLLAEENKDRKILLVGLARSSLHEQVSVSAMESVWALLRATRAEPGTYAQLPAAGPAYARLRASAAGSRIDEDAEPDSWVALR